MYLGGVIADGTLLQDGGQAEREVVRVAAPDIRELALLHRHEQREQLGIRRPPVAERAVDGFAWRLAVRVEIAHQSPVGDGSGLARLPRADGPGRSVPG